MGFLIRFIDILFDLLYIIVIIRVLLSWIRPNPRAGWVQFILQISEPIMAPFRLRIFRIGMIDLSPIIALFAISIMGDLIIRLILYFA